MERMMKKITHVGDCWIWTGCVTPDGYPRVVRNGNSNLRGHRYFYQQTKGEIPEGQVIRHTCDNPLCLNPDHLVLGTHTDNMRDRQERGRTQSHVTDDQNARIFELRKTGLPQWKVAEMVGCSQMHVSKLERGVYKLK